MVQISPQTLTKIFKRRHAKNNNVSINKLKNVEINWTLMGCVNFKIDRIWTDPGGVTLGKPAGNYLGYLC